MQNMAFGMRPQMPGFQSPEMNNLRMNPNGTLIIPTNLKSRSASSVFDGIGTTCAIRDEADV